LRLRQLLQFIASLGSLLARLACRRSMPICGRGSMLGEYPSPLLCATTDAMVNYGIMRVIQWSMKNEREQEKGRAGRKKSSSSSCKHSSPVTFRFSTERIVRRLAAAAAVGVPAITVTSSSSSSNNQPQAQVRLLPKDPWALRLTVWSRAAAPSVESSVVHLTLMELDLGLERGKPAGTCQSPDSLVESCPRLTMSNASRVQCEFLFRLRTDTRSVLEEAQESRIEKSRCTESPKPLVECNLDRAGQGRTQDGLDS
jgi:hypothetical protein